MVLYYIILYYIILYYIILYHIILYYAILHIILYYIMLCYILLYYRAPRATPARTFGCPSTPFCARPARTRAGATTCRPTNIGDRSIICKVFAFQRMFPTCTLEHEGFTNRFPISNVRRRRPSSSARSRAAVRRPASRSSKYIMVLYSILMIMLIL